MKWLVALAGDLERHRGSSLVIAGRRQPPAVHALAAALNAALGNVGATVDYGAPLTPDPLSGPGAAGRPGAGHRRRRGRHAGDHRRQPRLHGARGLQVRQAAGARPELDLLHALRRRDGRGLQGRRPGRARAGDVGRCPRHRRHRVDRPAADRAAVGRASGGGLLAAFLGEGDAGRAQAAAPLLAGPAHARRGEFDGNWERWLADGIVPDTGAAVRGRRSAIDGAALAQSGRAAARRAPSAGLEIAFVADPKVYDGRFANNAWLQELPHPITKLTWDNAAMLSEATAEVARRRDRRHRRGQLPRSPGRAPVMIVPGHADDAVTLPLGYGRTRPARAASPRRRVQRRRAAHERRALVRPRRRAREDRRGATSSRITQDHWTMSPDGREIRRRPSRPRSPRCSSATRSSTRRSRSAAARCRRSTSRSTTASSPTSGGCRSTSTSAPAAAPAWSPASRRTTSPSSAKRTSRKGREMQWIRIDRYFAGADRRPRRCITQPLDVRALRDGALRVRLPGQRHRPQRRGPERDGLQPLHRHPLLQQQLPVQGAAVQLPQLHRATTPRCARWRMNPDVTVRSARHHGEVHLLRAAHRAHAHRRRASRDAPSRDGELQTACQQGCPTRRHRVRLAQRPELQGVASCTPTRAATICCTRSAPARAPPTWRACATPTRSSRKAGEHGHGRTERRRPTECAIRSSRRPLIEGEHTDKTHQRQPARRTSGAAPARAGGPASRCALSMLGLLGHRDRLDALQGHRRLG